MLKQALLILGLSAFALSAPREEKKRHKYSSDPFAALDISHSLAQQYLWPFSQLMQAAAALDLEERIEEPLIKTDKDKFEINLNVKKYKPEDLRVKVKNRFIIVEGKHKENSASHQFMANHFVQRFVLPAGSKNEEVTAVLKPTGVLSISAPRHELPPPPPEREVPIEVLLPVEDKTENVVTTTEKKEPSQPVSTTVKIETLPTSSPKPLENLDLVEATTSHVGKIRKKELKDTAKTTKDNEVTKVLDGNVLDYAMIDSE